MTVDAKILALRLAILIERSTKKRLTISDKRLKDLAETKLLSIRYLSHLKDELEKLGYLFGNLTGGGFGLLVINSLEGAFPLKADRDDITYGLTEQQLITEISSLSLQKDQKKAKDTTITKEEIGILLWLELSDLAKKKQTIFYGNLAEELSLSNTHYNAFKRPLRQITAFCEENKLPLLSHLVVRQDTGLPVLMKPQEDNKLKHHEAPEKILDINWAYHELKFEEFVRAKSK